MWSKIREFRVERLLETPYFFENKAMPGGVQCVKQRIDKGQQKIEPY